MSQDLTPMDMSSFDDLLRAARQQPLPQRLLLVFTRAELPDDATPAQRAQFEAGAGGALEPALCVDKTCEELDSFAALQHESRQFGPAWQVLFASTLSGHAPSDQVIDQALQRMVECVRHGDLTHMIAFDAQGQTIALG